MFSEEYWQRVESIVEKAVSLAVANATGNAPAEEPWLFGKEVVREYEVSESTLLNMRTKTFDLRYETEWRMKRGKIEYLRKALDREFVRRSPKNNVVNLRKAG